MAAKGASPGALAKYPDLQTLRGHDAVVSQWLLLAKADRLPAVLLLTGREGIGKRLLLAVAASLHVCDTASACGTCANCRLAASGSHPEILWLANDGASLGVDDAAALQEHLALRPGQGSRYRVAVVEDCDRLTVPAANRLLKTLEEPAASARIVLSSSRPGALLATVKSRCVRWRIAPPAHEYAVEIFKDLCAEQGVELPSPAGIAARLKLAGGAPGVAFAQLLAGAGPPHASWPRSQGEAIEWAQGARSQTAAQVLAALETKLNFVYQSGAASGQAWALVARRRALIAAVRRASAHGKVAVSAQLLAESVGLVGTV